MDIATENVTNFLYKYCVTYSPIKYFNKAICQNNL